MNPLRLAVVGAGHLGRIHARAAKSLPDVRLVGVVDPQLESCAALARELDVACWPSVDCLAGQADAVVLAAPTQLHAPLGLPLLQQGIHCLIEKPLAPSTAAAEELVAAARAAGAVLQVGHIERFNPAFVAAQARVQDAKYIEATRCGSFTFRSTDIGVVLDLMIHDLDLVLALAQSPVRSVEALGLALFGQHEDVANARLHFENGCVASLSASRASPAAARRMQIWSRSGWIALDFSQRSGVVMQPGPLIREHRLDVAELTPQARADLKDRLHAEHLPVAALATEPCDQITAEQIDFVASIRMGRPPRVTGEQARDTLAVAEQILEQIGQHRWNGTQAGPVGAQLRMPAPLAGPHFWQSSAASRAATANNSHGLRSE